MKRLLGLVLTGALLGVQGCQGTLGIDPSLPAVQADDLTLVMSGCEAVPGRGMDICRVKEGQPIESVWRLVVPVGKNHFISGELTAYFRDLSKSYALKEPLLEIPWKDFFGNVHWDTTHDGEVMALAQIRWKTPSGVEEIWRARGIAKIVVTKPGYDPLPLDSGFFTWGTLCKIQYSTAGRSAVKCR